MNSKIVANDKYLVYLIDIHLTNSLYFYVWQQGQKQTEVFSSYLEKGLTNATVYGIELTENNGDHFLSILLSTRDSKINQLRLYQYKIGNAKLKINKDAFALVGKINLEYQAFRGRLRPVTSIKLD